MKKLQRFLSILILVAVLFNMVLPTFVYAVEYVELDVKERSADDDSNWLLTAIESGLAGIVSTLANALNLSVSKSVGQQVIIDDLIFNYQGLPAGERFPANKIRLF